MGAGRVELTDVGVVLGVGREVLDAAATATGVVRTLDAAELEIVARGVAVLTGVVC